MLAWLPRNADPMTPVNGKARVRRAKYWKWRGSMIADGSLRPPRDRIQPLLTRKSLTSVRSRITRLHTCKSQPDRLKTRIVSKTSPIMGLRSRFGQGGPRPSAPATHSRGGRPTPPLQAGSSIFRSCPHHRDSHGLTQVGFSKTPAAGCQGEPPNGGHRGPRLDACGTVH